MKLLMLGTTGRGTKELLLEAKKALGSDPIKKIKFFRRL